jgi:hypothetical protein
MLHKLNKHADPLLTCLLQQQQRDIHYNAANRCEVEMSMQIATWHLASPYEIDDATIQLRIPMRLVIQSDGCRATARIGRYMYLHKVESTNSVPRSWKPRKSGQRIHACWNIIFSKEILKNECMSLACFNVNLSSPIRCQNLCLKKTALN